MTAQPGRRTSHETVVAPQINLTPVDDGVYRAEWEERTYRYLLAGGDVVDVISTRDDSDLRAAVLEATGARRIDGVTEVSE